MCILFIAVDQHPKYPLIIAANRDEYHARASLPLHFWREHPRIAGGRDCAGGGGWFGVNAAGRIAAVTNHRGPAPVENARSRGQLVARFLQGGDARVTFETFLQREHLRYNPFHFVYGARGGLFLFSRSRARAQKLARGFHAIGNGALGDSRPKMSRGVRMLQECIEKNCVRESAIAEMMKDETVTAHAARAEKHSAPIFIRGETFGTRATTILLCAQKSYDMYEYTYSAGGAQTGRAHLTLETGGARL